MLMKEEARTRERARAEQTCSDFSLCHLRPSGVKGTLMAQRSTKLCPLTGLLGRAGMDRVDSRVSPRSLTALILTFCEGQDLWLSPCHHWMPPGSSVDEDKSSSGR